ncbi:hypothetical protein ABT263_09805 [Kitasatospora sp. NPDC001603]|uniref:hypothetical protein n=1 Tax=Kitasatospora sp. NPDC001603 TaxID=3154388 RepID=UPI00332AFC63
MSGSQEPRAEQRSGRHAAPRTPVRVRLRGRALAMAAVPTALLMAAAYTPNAAIAETSAGKPCATAPDTAPPVVAETPVPKSELPPPLPGPSVPLPESPATTPAGAPTGAPTSAPTGAPTSTPTTVPGAPAPSSSPASAPVRSATTGGSGGGVVQAGLIDDIVGGITNLIHPSASASPSASATTAAPAPTQAPVTAPAAGNRAVAPAAATQAPAAPAPSGATTPPAAGSGTPSPAATTPGAKASTPGAKASGKPSAGAKGTGSATPSGPATPSASGTPTKDPNCLVPMKGLAAGEKTDNAILVPDQNWTLQTSRLTLNHAVLMGVVKVQTPTGTKRVLKFVVDSVDIENLDMSTLEGNGKTFHVKGAPGSVSTMRKGPVTMYVEKLSGHLSKVLGLPIPIDLGELTLTPDGPLPQWLYDLIGKLELPLWLEMTGVTAVQSGQFGGTLKIPGMQLYNDDKPYVGNQ